MCMHHNKIFRLMFWVLFIVGALNAISYKLYLFWTVIWFDMVMHFLGGLFVALFFFAVFSLLGTKMRYVEKLVLGLTFTLLVGLVWEYYELIIGVTNLTDIEYWPNTGMDIVMDVAGGLAGIFAVKYIEKNNNG